MTAAIFVGSVGLFVGCGGNDPEGFTYPDYATTPEEGDSWNYVGKDDSAAITWYVYDDPSAVIEWNNLGVTKIVKEKTGVNIRFVAGGDDPEQFLSALISNDNTPDVVSVKRISSVAKLMIAENMVYPINELAKRWAPSLNRRLQNNQKDIYDFYTSAGDNLFWLPYGSWSESEADKISAPTDYYMVVRKDMYEWYVKNHPEIQEKDIATKSGFKAMLKELYETFNYTKGSAQTIDGITQVKNLRGLTVAGADGIQTMAEYFAAPYETEDGKYVDRRTTDRYYEAIEYLNDLYNDGLIPEQSFTDTKTETATIMSNRQSIAFIGGVTNGSFKNYRIFSGYNVNIDYTPLIITNGAGEEPVLRSKETYGSWFNMITTSCSRPDLVIKLFDFLWSDEGQRLISFGEEGKVWNYDTEGDNPLRLKYNDEWVSYRKDWGEEWTKYGIRFFWLMERTSFYEATNPTNTWGKNETRKRDYNGKLDRLAYPYKNFTELGSVALDKDSLMLSNQVESVWNNNVASLITCGKNDVKKRYDGVISMMNTAGLGKLDARYEELFQKLKTKKGVTRLWPTYLESFTRVFKDSDGNLLMTDGVHGDLFVNPIIPID